MTNILNLDRLQLLDILPKNGTVVEIGVYRGEYSEQILKKTQPKKLILIDPWKTMLDANTVDPLFDSFYKEVKEKFKNNVNVEIIRKTSSTATIDIEDNSLDWLYIDGDHHYEPCLNDLRMYASKVKDNGYICGHDWVTKPKFGFGVNDAVTKFIEETKFKLVGLTNESNFKTYIIAKTDNGAKQFNER